MMEQRKLNTVLEYLKSSQQGNITTGGNKEYRKFKIDGIEYHYNKDKPIQGKLKKKLEHGIKNTGIQKTQDTNKISGKSNSKPTD